MNWKKLTVLCGIAVAIAAIPCASAQERTAPRTASVSGMRPSSHWRGHAGHHRHWHHRHWHHRHHHHRRFYVGYPFGYPFGYGYGYPYWGASAALYYSGYHPYRAYRADSSGRSVVVQVQQELARAGYYRGAIDGVLGNGTRSAIRAYERANRLPVDGRLDTELLRTMGLS